MWSVVEWKENSAVLSCTDARECSIELTVGKHRCSYIDDGFVERESDTAVEGARVSEAQRKLDPLNCPTGVRWVEFEADSWNAVYLL